MCIAIGACRRRSAKVTSADGASFDGTPPGRKVVTSPVLWMFITAISHYRVMNFVTRFPARITTGSRREGSPLLAPWLQWRSTGKAHGDQLSLQGEPMTGTANRRFRHCLQGPPAPTTTLERQWRRRPGDRRQQRHLNSPTHPISTARSPTRSNLETLTQHMDHCRERDVRRLDHPGHNRNRRDPRLGKASISGFRSAPAADQGRHRLRIEHR